MARTPKYDDSLNPILDDAGTRDGGDTATGAAGSRGTGSGASSASSGRKSASSADHGNGGEIGADDGGDDELPLGISIPARKRQYNRRAARQDRVGSDGDRDSRRGTGIGSDSGDSDRGSSSSDGGASAQETPFVAGGPAPRQVKFSELGGGKATAKDSKLTKQFIAEGYVILFDAAGFIAHDKETWQIERDGDAAELAERTHSWIQSLDRNKAAKWDKILAKWQPFLMLLMALVAVVGPRIAQTSHKRKQRALDLQKASNGNRPTGSGSSAASGPSPVVGTINPNAGGPGNAGGHGANGKNEHPIRREDFDELFAETNRRPM